MNTELNALARNIKLLLMDVDGVLTDGKLYNVPGPDGKMVLVFNDLVFNGQIEQKQFAIHHLEEQLKAVQQDVDRRRPAGSRCGKDSQLYHKCNIAFNQSWFCRRKGMARVAS